jgi:hypothetical protein
MPDPTLDEVMEEAYASASSDKILIETISIYYSGLINDVGQPDEVYLFNGDNSASVSDEGVPLLPARLEEGAERNSGQVVTFLGRPFTIVPAPMNTESIVVGSLRIDSVGREMHDMLEAAAKGGKAIEITYRTYIKGNELTGPQSLPPRKFHLQGATGDNTSVSGQLAFIAIGNRPYPYDSYRPDRFKTLQWA